jgi:ribonuclease III
MSTNHEYRQFEECLNYRFAELSLLRQALTHSSFANEHDAADGDPLADNEQLEFLGDAVLSLLTSEYLCRQFPHYSEGQLSKLRAHLVSARHLSKAARTLEAGKYLRLGRGEERTGGRNKQAILADCVEAIIAAVYLDGGLEAARGFVLPVILTPELERMGSDPAAGTAHTDYKSTLQELLQGKGLRQPVYEVVAQSGPEHNKVFVVELSFDADLKVRAEGRSKKHAEQRAAELALEHFRTHPIQEQA